MKKIQNALLQACAWSIVAMSSTAANADVTVGVTLSTTGPSSSLGIPQRNSMALWPKEIAGQPLHVVLLDDASDSTQANQNARKLITSDNADILIGSSSAPPSLAVANVANELHVPQISLSPINMPAGTDHWTFRIAQPVSLMAQGIADDIKKRGFKRVGFLGFSDSYGEDWLKNIQQALAGSNAQIVVTERYARADTSVTAQVLRITAANPDAVLVAGAGTAAALPQIAFAQRGYHGQIYQTHGAASYDTIRVAGKAMEGVILPAGPALVPEQLPATAQVKAPGLQYVQWYEGRYGKNSRTQFGPSAYDAVLVLQRIVPVALKKAAPGTPAFREALRDALESQKDIVASHGVFNFTATDHFGVDKRARAMLQVVNGEWKLVDY
ncbi:ABC transporter substrate-binding protein [Paraburkholderia sp.]|uniref:ABC transporter substrate-binding protein n=1 Tax=Paraburkholderia sp. TaxID=1926495 RepID=UPI0023973567|nr:ABC transporter substrate-binding protein [Paraburkholderia sp.]MDE1182609.1 ABC transporter substrate-binding protein [Paraburkholderia sp.]